MFWTRAVNHLNFFSAIAGGASAFFWFWSARLQHDLIGLQPTDPEKIKLLNNITVFAAKENMWAAVAAGISVTLMGVASMISAFRGR